MFTPTIRSLDRRRRRTRSAVIRSFGVVCTAISCLTYSACSSGKSEDCPLNIEFAGHLYTAIGFHLAEQHLRHVDLLPVGKGRMLGVGRVPDCSDPSGRGDNIDVFAIRGIDPHYALTTNEATIVIRQGKTIPKQLVR